MWPRKPPPVRPGARVHVHDNGNSVVDKLMDQSLLPLSSSSPLRLCIFANKSCYKNYLHHLFLSHRTNTCPLHFPFWRLNSVVVPYFDLYITRIKHPPIGIGKLIKSKLDSLINEMCSITKLYVIVFIDSNKESIVLRTTI